MVQLSEETVARRLTAIKAFISSNTMERVETARNIYLLAIHAPCPEVLGSHEDGFVEAMFSFSSAKNLDPAIQWEQQFSTEAQERRALSNSGPTVSSSPRFKSWAELSPKITSYLAALRALLDLYLRAVKEGRALPTWDPPEEWDGAFVQGTNQSMRSYLQDRKIPMNPYQRVPDLLLYLLADYQHVDTGRMLNRVYRILSGDSHRIVANTSGSGKTRILLESLCRSWGLYLPCTRNVQQNPFGSGDLEACLEKLHIQSRQTSDGKHFVEDAGNMKRTISAMRRRAEYDANYTIIRDSVRIMLLSRLLIFKIFCDAVQHAALPEAQAKRAWVLFQLFPCVSKHSGTLSASSDAFEILFHDMARLDPDETPSRLRAVLDELPEEMQPRLLVFDETQVLTTKWSRCFVNAGMEWRSLLKPVAATMFEYLQAAKIIMGGTKLYAVEVQEALGSFIFKSHPVLTFTDLGGYFRDQDISMLLNHLFGGLHKTWALDIQNNIGIWLRGRHRFLALFAQWVLMKGPSERTVRNVIANIVFAATGQHLEEYSSIYQHLDDLNIPDLVPGVFKQNKDTKAIHCARKAVVQFLTQRTFPHFTMDRFELVDLGIGRFISTTEGGHIIISERLVLCGLMAFFDNPRSPGSIRHMINDTLSNGIGNKQFSGLGFEDAMIYLFWTLFTPPSGTPLSDVFNFHPNLLPQWKDLPARLVSFSEAGIPSAVSRGLTSVLAIHANSMSETLRWFENNDSVPFLKPDNLCGPDIIFVLRLERGDGQSPRYLVVCVQCKKWSVGIKSGLTVQDAVYTASPEGLYRTKEEQRKIILQLLKRFPSLTGTRVPPGAKLMNLPSDTDSELSEPSQATVANMKKNFEEFEQARENDESHSAISLPELSSLSEITESDEAVKKKQDVQTSRKLRPKKIESPQGTRTTAKRRKTKAATSKDEHPPFVYGKSIEFGVLRVFAAFPNSVSFEEPFEEEHGVYPFATISTRVLQMGTWVGFEAFRAALSDAGEKYFKYTEEEMLEQLNDKAPDGIRQGDTEIQNQANQAAQEELMNKQLENMPFEDYEASEYDDAPVSDSGKKPSRQLGALSEHDSEDESPIPRQNKPMIRKAKTQTTADAMDADSTDVDMADDDEAGPSTTPSTAKRNASLASINPRDKKK